MSQTVFADQEAVEVEVFQGESPHAHRNVRIGTFLFEGLNTKRGAHEEGILLTYELDLDGILHMGAVERATGREISAVVENATGRANLEELQDAGQRVEKAWQGRRPGDWVQDAQVVESAGAETEDAGEAEEQQLLRRAEEVLDKGSPEDRMELVFLMEDLREAARAGRRKGRRPPKRWKKSCSTWSNSPAPWTSARPAAHVTERAKCATGAGRNCGISCVLEAEARRWEAAAWQALKLRDGATAWARARRACAIQRTASGERALALAALLEGRYGEALALWRETEEV